MIITALLDTIYRYRTRHDSYRIRRKFGRLGLSKHVKRQNLSQKDLHDILLRSEKNHQENNYLK